MRIASLLFAAALAFVTPAIAADQVLVPEDSADLEALFAKGDAKAMERITKRLDALIDELVAALPAAPEAGEKPKKSKSSKKKADDSAFKDDAGLEAKIVSASTAWRLAQLADKQSPSDLASSWKGFAAAPTFAQMLRLSYAPRFDDKAKLLEVARGVVGDNPRIAEQYPELATAICVVYDKPRPFEMINENRPAALPANVAWNYFANNAGKMRFGVHIAPELLAFVVDVHASPDEIAWALSTFHGVPRVGGLYPKVPYDYDCLRGKPKKSDQAGWNLPNIMRFGGICADQAYFTATVAKSLGIPATYTTGENAESAHAWVGFVQASGKRTYWDSEGRYDSYRGITGFVTDPQSGRRENDAIMPMLVQWGLEPGRDRLHAATLRVVDERLQERMKGDDAGSLARTRSSVLRMALRSTPTDVRTWLRVRELAKSGAMDDRDRAAWFEDVSTLCGASYPEMVLEVTEPMISSIKDLPAQHSAWMKLATFLSKRADLAGQALLRDGKMWEIAKEPEKAGQAYEALLKAYPDGGPYVERALSAASRILMAQRDGKRLLALYDATFKRMRPPEELPGLFGRDSTWYAVGKAYVALLREAGRGGDAANLDARIERVVRTAGETGS